jgi:hypothetical protein
MAMSWLRRNRKILIGVLVAVLMVAWGALPALRYLVTSGAQTRGEIRGETVGARDLQRASRELSSLTQAGVLQRNRGIGGFIFGDQETRGASTGAVWRYLVLAREAEAANIRVLDSELQGIFAPEGPLPRGDRYLRNGVVNLIRISKLQAFRTDTIHTGMAEQWLDYYHQNYETKLRLVELPSEIFLPLVEIAGDEVMEFYEQRKEQPPEPRTGAPGYLAPDRVRLEYAFASVEEFKEQVSVTDEEIKEYYEEHKSEYEIEEPEEEEQEPKSDDERPEGASETPKEGDETESQPETEAGDPGDPAGEAKSENAPENKAGEGEIPETVDGEDGAENEETGEVAQDGPEADGPQYQPLEKVREEIEKKLVDQKAERMAAERVEKALDDLEAAASDYVNEPLPLQQMARRYELRYVQPTAGDGRRFLSREEIRSALPGGSRAARRVFDEDLQINYVSLVETQEGPLVVQVLERRDARPEPFEVVRERVEQDLRQQKALEEAQTLAEKLMAAASEKSLEQAVKEMNERLVNLLGPPPAKDETEADESADGGEEEDETAEASPGEEAEDVEPVQQETTEEPQYLRVIETEYLSLSQARIEALGARRQEVVRKGLTLPQGEMALVSEGPPDSAWYVIEKVAEREPDPAGFWAWMQQERFRTMFMGPRVELQAWLDSLLEKSPPPTEEEK